MKASSSECTSSYIHTKLGCLGPSVHATLAACGGGGGKEDVAEQTWDCMAENAEDSEVFGQSMLMMLPTASNHIYCLVSDTAGYGTLSRRNRIVGTSRQGTARRDALDGSHVVAGRRCSVAGRS